MRYLTATLPPWAVQGSTRAGYVFFDLADPSDIPSIAEPLFQELKATVEFFPAMNAAQLGAGLTKASGAWTRCAP